MGERRVIELPSNCSDGSNEYWPTTTDYVYQPQDRLYHTKLADLWMGLTDVANTGTEEKCIFKELPAGYRIYTKERNNRGIKPILNDRYIFGHKRGRFDSPKKFFKHFKYLMQGASGECDCVNCFSRATRGATHPPMTHISSPSPVSWDNVKPQLQQLQDFLRESQKNPDIELKKAWAGGPCADILLNGHTFKETASRYRTLPAFLPRKGELVLFYTSEQPNCRFEGSTQYLKLFNEISGQFVGFPLWRAGVVSQEPEEKLGLADLSPFCNEHTETRNKFYRIDLYPDPEGEDKTLSNKSYLVKLNHIRPLNMFHEVLSGLPQKKWHCTIHNALKVMSTTCLVEPKLIRGQWPSATITCRGIWIGSELFVVGDAVRLMPKKLDADQVDSALIIECVEWTFDNADLSEEQSSVKICGKMFTTNKTIAFCQTPITLKENKDNRFPASLNGYTWYPMNKPDEGDPFDAKWMIYWRMEVPISRIIGRLYDSEAMEHFLDIADFDVGKSGIKEARRWAKRSRKDITTDSNCEWVFTTDRIEALAIETLNGLTVGSSRNRENVGIKSGDYLPTVGPSSRVHMNRRQLIGVSFGRPARYHSNCGSGESGSDKGILWEAVEASGADEIDGDILADDKVCQAQSLKFTVSDHTPRGTENEDKDHSSFISEIPAAKLLPKEGEGMREDVADADKNRTISEIRRVSKRPRL